MMDSSNPILDQDASNTFYEEATMRNLGLLSEEEQAMLRQSTVAIAGMGAVGGHYLIALTRMGVGRFIIADPDVFEVANLHRQAGAFKQTLGESKVETMARMAREINPEVDIRVFPHALDESNAEEFLADADVALDGIDFFQIDARRALLKSARKRGIYGITSGPIGYGASLQVFDPKGMGFDEYFGIEEGMTRAERIAAFAIGLVPKLSKAKTMDPSRIDFEKEKGPALVSSIMLCAGIVTNEVLRILTHREPPLCVPHALFFDPYSRSYTHVRHPRNRWIDRLVRRIAFKNYPSLLRLHETEKQALETGEPRRKAVKVASKDALVKVDKAYDSPPWWYDIRGFFILCFSYRSTLWAQIRFFGRNMGKRHIEVAVGTGTLLSIILTCRKLFRRKDVSIVGVDYAESMLAGARKTFSRRPNVKLSRQDAAALQFEDNSFDTMNIANSVHCFPDVEGSLREAFRVLKPGATLALNALLYPRGPRLLRHIADCINTWGIKKGILITPFYQDDVRDRIQAAGFEVIEEAVSGNALMILARKPGPLEEKETIPCRVMSPEPAQLCAPGELRVLRRKSSSSYECGHV